MKPFALTLLLSVFTLLTCSKESPMTPVSSAGSIRGKVVNRIGAPVPGARVALNAGSGAVLTDSLGGFTLAGLGQGGHQLTVTAEFYQDTTFAAVPLEKDQALTLSSDLLLRSERAFIRGVVRDSAGGTVANAGVAVDSQNLATLTDGEGRFLLSLVRVGQIRVLASGNGRTASTVLGTAPDSLLDSLALTLAGNSDSLIGRIYRGYGMAIPYCTLSVMAGAVRAVADSAGQFTLKGLQRGFSLPLSAREPGYPSGWVVGYATVPDYPQYYPWSFYLRRFFLISDTLIGEAGKSMLLTVEDSGYSYSKKYSWDLNGDGRVDTVTEFNRVSMVPRTAGTFHYGVTGVDSLGNRSNTATLTLVVSNPLIRPAQIPAGYSVGESGIYSVSGDRVTIINSDTYTYCSGSELVTRTSTYQNMYRFELAGNVLNLIDEEFGDGYPAGIELFIQFSRVSGSGGLPGVWRFSRFAYDASGVSLTSAMRRELDSIMTTMNSLYQPIPPYYYFTADQAQLYFQENISGGLYSAAQEFIDDWNRSEALRYGGITVSRINDNEVRLAGSMNNETVAIRWDADRNRYYSSTDPQHASHIYYQDPQSCPNEYQPAWYYAFLAANARIMPDTLEPNNSVSSASGLTLGSYFWLNASLTSGDVDWYRFQAVSATTYRLQVYGNQNGTSVSVFGSDGATLVDSTLSRYSTSMTLTGLPAGTVYVRVSTGDTTAQTYSLSIEGVAVVADDSYEPDNSPSKASMLSVGDTSPAHVIVVGDTDYFRFSAVSGNTYTIESHSSLDLYGSLLSDSGAYLAYNDDEGIGANFMIVWQCNRTGAYYLAVRPFGGSSQGSYRVSLRIGGTVLARPTASADGSLYKKAFASNAPGPQPGKPRLPSSALGKPWPLSLFR